MVCLQLQAEMSMMIISTNEFLIDLYNQVLGLKISQLSIILILLSFDFIVKITL